MDRRAICYNVRTFRQAGLQAKWTREDGRPVIMCRNPHDSLCPWIIVDTMIFKSMQSGLLGTVYETFLKWQAFATIQPQRVMRGDY
jgi:hypothetical protein